MPPTLTMPLPPDVANDGAAPPVGAEPTFRPALASAFRAASEDRCWAANCAAN